MVLAPASLDRAALQRKVIRTLVVSQVLGGVGMAAGIAVGALLAEDLSGTEALAGVGTTAQVLGTALITIPVARATAARGRRLGPSARSDPRLRRRRGRARVGRDPLVPPLRRRHVPLRRRHHGQQPVEVCRRRPRGADAAWAGPVDRRVGHDDRVGGRAEPRRAGQGAGQACSGCPSLRARSSSRSSASRSPGSSSTGCCVRTPWSRRARWMRGRGRRTRRSGAGRGWPAAGAGGRRRRRRSRRPSADVPEPRRVDAPRARDHAGQPAGPPGDARHGPRPPRHGECHGDDADPHEARPRRARGDRLRHLRAHPRHVRAVTARRDGRRPLGRRRRSPWRGRRADGRALLASRSQAGWSGLLLVALFLLGVGWSCTLVSGSTLLTCRRDDGRAPGHTGHLRRAHGPGGARGRRGRPGVVVGPLGYCALALGAAVVGSPSSSSSR